jgi:hypothetical protein
VRPLRKLHTEKFQPFILYLDDIEYIYNTLCKYSTEVSIKTKEYELDSPKHLPDLKQESINELRFQSNEPFMLLNLLRDGAEMVVYDDDSHSMAAVSDIKRLISKKRRVVNNWFAITGLVAILAIFYALAEMNRVYDRIYIYAFLTLSVVWGGGVAYLLSSKHSVVILSYKINSPSWWKRNQDNLIVGVILVLIGVIIGYFIK